MQNPDSPGDLGISRKDMDEFLRVCQAFKTIRDRRLYRNEFASFDDYCRAKYRMPGAQIEKFIAEAELELQARKAKSGLQ
jgi:hypothetical protein